MAVNKRLLQGAAAAGGLVPSEHFGVVLYEGDGSTSHSINGGKFGAGAYFNGSNGKIDINRSVLAGDDWTISMWVRVASGTPYTNYRFFDSSYGDYAGKLRLGISTDGTVNVAQGNSTSVQTSFNSTGTINDNTWHNLSVTFDGTTARLYIDGSADGTGTPSNYSDSSGDARIGGGNTITGSNPFKPCEGKIDQVRFFSKALSSSEVSTLYAETLATSTSLDPLSEDTTDTLQVLGDSSCIATYRFENNEDDLSGSYDGTGTEIQYAAGRYGQSAYFNGSSSVITLPSALSDGSTTDANCISFWFNVGAEVTSSTANNEIMNFAQSSSNLGKIALGSTTGNFTGETFSVTSDVNTQYTYSKTNIPAGWNHAVVQWNSGNTKWDIYINGVAHTTYTFGTNEQGKWALKFGNRHTFYYTGKLDQVRIFNKALSASEVTTLYNENSLVASYRFEGNANDDTRNYDGTATNVTYEYGLNFTPDLVWLKQRGFNTRYRFADSTRGATNYLVTDGDDAEFNSSTNILSFVTGGFTVGSATAANADGGDYVAWCLKANGGTTSTNNDGNITSTVQANTNAGFAIATVTGNGTTDTFGHGLGATPEVIIRKNLTSTDNWNVYTTVIDGSLDFMKLNLTDAKGDSSYSNPTSTVFTNPADTNTRVYYSFVSVAGYSKIGTYTGNGSTNGPIVETGFEPAFVMIKRTSNVGGWVIYDNKRNLTNPRNLILEADLRDVERSYSDVDFLSNGFQIKGTNSGVNSNGDTFIYMAFAADPDTEAPTVANSFSTVTYTGNGTSQSIEGLGFAPNLVWIKNRDATDSHQLFDTTRGANKAIFSNLTTQETTYTNRLMSFDSNGFSIGAASSVNTNNEDYVAWAWKADDNEPTIFGGPAVAVYKFEDTANDATGSYNGTATNITYSSSGKFNKSAVFDGTSKISTSLDFDTYDENWSISYWVKFTFDSNYRAILGSTDATVKNGMVTDIGTSGQIRFRLRNTIGSVSSLSSTATYGDGNWHHVVCVKSSSTNYLYIDGQLDSSTTTTNGINHSALNLGTFGLSSTEFFKGELDQVRIYNGALAQEQVTELYNETASDNDDLTYGGLPEILISANANAGFSIVKYEGNGNELILPTGLSSKVEMVITKSTSSISQWMIWHKDLSGNSGTNAPYNLYFGTDAELNLSAWGTYNQFTATTFPVTRQSAATAHNNNNGQDYIAYCFHSVSGYSKFGSYSGTGSSGNSVTTGFQPDWIMIKRTDTSGSSWGIFDSVRGGNLMLRADTNSADADGNNSVSFNSDGFTLPETGVTTNASGGTYIYMAFKIN